MNIRKVELKDARSICSIYNYYVANTAITFEGVPVKEKDMKNNISDVVDSGYAYYVGEVDGKIVGYCYVNRWNSRCSCASTYEITIYVDNDERGKGYGTKLMEHTLDSIDTLSVHSILATISLPNESSVRLLEKFGFKQVSHLKEVGCKFSKWIDTGQWQLVFGKRAPKVLIICTGNSCRSQMAHGFLKSFDPALEVYSAGCLPAKQVNPKAVEVMSEIGVDISSHRPHSIDEYTGEKWDFVITVCGSAHENCPTFTGKVHSRLHFGFDDPSEAIGTDEYIMSEFIRVRDEIREKFYKFYIRELKFGDCCETKPEV